MTRLRGPVAALAGAALVTVLGGCGPAGTQSQPGGPSPAGDPTAAEVAVVEQAVRAADGTLGQAERQLAGD